MAAYSPSIQSPLRCATSIVEHSSKHYKIKDKFVEKINITGLSYFQAVPRTTRSMFKGQVIGADRFPRVSTTVELFHPVPSSLGTIPPW